MPQTAAQRAASLRNLEKARIISAEKRHARKQARSVRVPQRPTPQGFQGLKANFVPYARVNKRSGTVGYNAGTRIPGTHKRIVTGSYVRLESTRRDNPTVKSIKKATGTKFFPHGTKRRARLDKVKSYGTPTIAYSARASVKGHQVRLGTSRGAGPTVIVRRGKHKVAPEKSMRGVTKYNKRMSQIAGQKTSVKKPRPQRRRAARKKKG